MMMMMMSPGPRIVYDPEQLSDDQTRCSSPSPGIPLSHCDPITPHPATYVLFLPLCPLRHKGAVVRTHDGRLQHVQGGVVEFEVEGCRGGQAAPLAVMADDSVVLAATDRGEEGQAEWGGLGSDG